MWIHITGWQIVDLGTLGSLIVPRWRRWHCGQRWHRFWSVLSVSVRWRCNHPFLPPAGLQILCGAVAARKASVCVVLTKRTHVSFHRSLHLYMPWDSSIRFFSSQTSVGGIVIRYCISFIAAHENPSLANLDIFKARRMSDCSSCSRPPCLAIVADMLKPYKKLVAASHNEIRLLPQPYMLA